ncbi:MAG TPA: ATP-dependent helicase [Candidatus Acidoferrales bacterium]|nr:ATP-dependent helicase [Candidatus Acidoferrales bacterium]
MNADSYIQAAEELRANDGQWRVYESEGNCVVQAGPGGGKTKTITIKIARLLGDTIRRPRRLACITYSNACVGELRRRLRGLGIADDDRLLLSTVHSFCLTELVLPYAQLAGINVPDPLVVASPSQSREIFRQAYVQKVGGICPGWFRTECDKLRRTILDHDGAEWKAWTRRETAVVEAYEALLLENGLIDFDGLVLVGLELVEKHEWVRRSIKAKYPVLVIDEYQDLGLPLHRMVLALMNKAGVRIIAVGDPDQSIYGFTGAKPSLLKTLEKVPGVEPVRLKLNYRCADQIIAASKTLLTDPADFQSHDGRQGEILIYEVERDVRGQADYALGTVVPALLKENPTWKAGDIALLYRTLNEGQAIAEAADALGLRYFRLDNGSPIKRSRLTEWLTDAAQWCSGGWQSGTVSLADLLKSWRLMRRSLTRPADVLEARAKLIATLFAHRDGSIPLRGWLAALRDAALDDAFNQEPGLADEKDNFEDLLKAASKGGPLESYSVKIFGNQGRSPDQINLMTLHSSKGLEFEAVIMVGLEAGVFPSSYDRTDEKLEEAARLFYVGVTRAKSMVHLMYESNESPFITSIRQSTGVE